jgi:hypothetical protein
MAEMSKYEGKRERGDAQGQWLALGVRRLFGELVIITWDIAGRAFSVGKWKTKMPIS